MSTAFFSPRMSLLSRRVETLEYLAKALYGKCQISDGYYEHIKKTVADYKDGLFHVVCLEKDEDEFIRETEEILKTVDEHIAKSFQKDN